VYNIGDKAYLIRKTKAETELPWQCKYCYGAYWDSV